MVVVTKEHLPKEGLVHGELPAFPAVSSLRAGVRDELARAAIHPELVILNAPDMAGKSGSYSFSELGVQLTQQLGRRRLREHAGRLETKNSPMRSLSPLSLSLLSL